MYGQPVIDQIGPSSSCAATITCAWSCSRNWLFSICPGCTGSASASRPLAAAAPGCPGGDRGRDRVGLTLGGAVGGADLHLPLRRALSRRALLHDVGQLVRHQAEVAAALALPQEHVAAVGERARAHRGGRLLRERIVVDTHAREVRAEVVADPLRDTRVHGPAAAAMLDRRGRRVVDRRRAAGVVALLALDRTSERCFVALRHPTPHAVRYAVGILGGRLIAIGSASVTVHGVDGTREGVRIWRSFV